MFLNNTLYENGIYNVSIGIIMKVHMKSQESIDVAFLTRNGLCYVTINKTTKASRRQFPI